MSLSALILMLISIAMLWGVAGWAFVRSLRQEEAKQRLAATQGGCEPFCPRAFRDLEAALGEPGLSRERRRELKACHRQQQRALARGDAHFYDWPEHGLPPASGMHA